jgi:hypothetical protein
LQIYSEPIKRILEKKLRLSHITYHELFYHWFFDLQVELLSSECLEDARRVNATLEREETLRKIAAEEKAKYLEAIREVEEAKRLLAKESYERKIAEWNALKESIEKQRIVDSLFSNDMRYRRYTRNEIEVATEFFSQGNVIGEGGYGKVYKCNLNHTPVAVKVLSHDEVGKKEEFLKEVPFAYNPFHFSVTVMFLNKLISPVCLLSGVLC